MPRRGENIYKRKDGRWEGRYIVDHRPDGRAIYHSVYGPTYGEVQQKLKTQQEAHHKRQLRGCTMTVKELFANWQEESGHVKPTTRERYAEEYIGCISLNLASVMHSRARRPSNTTQV